VVRTDQIAPAVPRFSSHYLDFSSKRGVGWYGHTLKISPTGVMGDPTRASAEKGRRMWDIIVANLVEMIEDIKELSLEDIHQRRY
jgi:creatinine amidohydrolase/Fe(II)-dependent formamide hydrolase-like protein